MTLVEMKRTETEDETGRESCVLQRGAETDSDGWRCFQMTGGLQLMRSGRQEREEHLVGKETRRLGGERGSAGG